jgi:glyoxylase-like metal-dependent hydrolase (beta-lactamase superfamily II)/rhodanese-related sulfurtransferase
LKYIFETHFHADFISGHIDLASQTNATIVFGPLAEPNYNALIAADNQVFELGDCKLKILHTPGHTIESICILLYDENNIENSLFSGDTIFVGDVGRPDLLSGNLSKETLAEMMFDSIKNKILPINDNVLLYPGHGPGSACGRKLGAETVSTLGVQKKLNYALQPLTKENFVLQITENLPEPPAYFFKDAAINKHGYNSLNSILQNEMIDLTSEDVRSWVDKKAMILDVRSANNFAIAHIKNSLNIGLDGTLAIFAGSLIALNQPIVLICDMAKELEPLTRLARVGFENIVGYWDDDLYFLKQVGIQIIHTNNIEAEDIKHNYENDDLIIIDVRTKSEFEKGFLKGAINIPLNILPYEIENLDPQAEYLIYCAGGYRSMIAASIMQRYGFNFISNVKGGITEVQKKSTEFLQETELSV